VWSVNRTGWQPERRDWEEIEVEECRKHFPLPLALILQAFPKGQNDGVSRVRSSWITLSMRNLRPPQLLSIQIYSGIWDPFRG